MAATKGEEIGSDLMWVYLIGSVFVGLFLGLFFIWVWWVIFSPFSSAVWVCSFCLLGFDLVWVCSLPCGFVFGGKEKKGNRVCKTRFLLISSFLGSSCYSKLESNKLEMLVC